MFYRLNDDGSILDWSESSYHEDCLFTEKQVVKGWDGARYLEGDEPEKPKELLEVEIQKQLTDAVQHVLDSKAQELNYDNCLSVCSYIDTGVPKFDAEGRAFRSWRSAVWAKGYEILAQVQAGEREIPTESELIAELPVLVIDYENASA